MVSNIMAVRGFVKACSCSRPYPVSQHYNTFEHDDTLSRAPEGDSSKLSKGWYKPDKDVRINIQSLLCYGNLAGSSFHQTRQLETNLGVIPILCSPTTAM